MPVPWQRSTARALPTICASPLRLSLGTASYPSDGRQVHVLLTCADVNLYQSKRHGGDVVTCANHEETLEKVSIGASACSTRW
jgi:predicted signal transduction protein with EAL and GGDEF domain